MFRAVRRLAVCRVLVAGCLSLTLIIAEAGAARASRVRSLADTAGHRALVRRRERAKRDDAREHDERQRRRQNYAGDWRAGRDTCLARDWHRGSSVRAARRFPVTLRILSQEKGKRQSEEGKRKKVKGKSK
jgi:hypothetical protein